jgi:hypothetical protein
VPNVPQPHKLFCMHPMELQGDMGHVKSHFGRFEDSVMVQDRCTVCAKYTIGLAIILDTPDGTPR